MVHIFQIGSPPIDVHFRRSARAKRLSLRVSGTDGTVRLTAPRFTPLRAAEAFAKGQEAWLKTHLSRQPRPVAVGMGETIMFEGRLVEIVPGDGRSVTAAHDRLFVPGRDAEAGARLKGFFKARARDCLVPAAQKYAEKLGAPINRISFKDTRSRWGSCTAKGNLMFSWRLILAPPDVADYVAAHEAAHLIELNHSASYWTLVRDLRPDYARHRKWLSQHGQELQRYTF